MDLSREGRSRLVVERASRPSGGRTKRIRDRLGAAIETRLVHGTGLPAVDKGANQPYVFYDAISSEGGFPVYSNGRRDDLIQRRYIEALLDYWSPANGNNPVSAVYGAPMIDVANAHAWAWDARPFPDFPLRTEIWRDAPNWAGGHWLTGRLGQLSLADLVTALCAPVGIVPDVSGLNGLVDGYVLDRVMSPRDALEPLMLAFAFDALESEGAMRFRMRGVRRSSRSRATTSPRWRRANPRTA